MSVFKNEFLIGSRVFYIDRGFVREGTITAIVWSKTGRVDYYIRDYFIYQKTRLRFLWRSMTNGDYDLIDEVNIFATETEAVETRKIKVLPGTSAKDKIIRGR